LRKAKQYYNVDGLDPFTVNIFAKMTARVPAHRMNVKDLIKSFEADATLRLHGLYDVPRSVSESTQT